MVTKNQNTSSLKKCEDDMTNMNHIICCLLRSQQNLTKQKHFFGIANDINTHKWLYASRENKPVLEQLLPSPSSIQSTQVKLHRKTTVWWLIYCHFLYIKSYLKYLVDGKFEIL